MTLSFDVASALVEKDVLTMAVAEEEEGVAAVVAEWVEDEVVEVVLKLAET